MQRLPTNIHSKNLLAQLDLNLLRLFLSIYHTRNLTQTAEQLHISQSAVSHALNRLRQALDDALFYREKGGLHPTAYARRIYPILHQANKETYKPDNRVVVNFAKYIANER